MNPVHTTADLLKLEVIYHGQNGVKQHLFANGTAIVTHVFDSLEEAFQRFGKRIKIDSKAYALSLNFKQGYAATAYAPRPNADRVERIEYGMGYLKGLIDRGERERVVPKPVDMRMPHEVLQDKMKAEKAKGAAASIVAIKDHASKSPGFKAMLEASNPPEPKSEVAARLEASRAALLNPPIPVADDDMEIGDVPTDPAAGDAPSDPVAQVAISTSITNIVKRGRGRPPKGAV